MSALYVVLALVVAQRLGELILASRNTRRLLAEGAVEVGARHYPLFILLHSGWLLAVLLTTDPETPLNWGWAAVFLTIEVGRVWVLSALGRFFTTRIVTLPDAPLVKREAGTVMVQHCIAPIRFARGVHRMVLLCARARVPVCACVCDRPAAKGSDLS
jgi:isoprenylcysteine carboxyl methyltransferase (ICMT) family protein YpbQ